MRTKLILGFLSILLLLCTISVFITLNAIDEQKVFRLKGWYG
jgi:hypothetical protein